MALLEDAEDPALVVTSDRELARRCADLRVDIVPSEAFLRAVGG